MKGGKQYECSLAGSKNQKFEFRSRLQLRRIGVHINQQRTGTAQDVARRAERQEREGRGGEGKECAASQSVSQMWFFPHCCCVSFVNQVEMPHRVKKKLEIEASCEN